MLQQAVGEPSRGRADVEARLAGCVQPGKRLERALELLAAAANEPRRHLDLDLRVFRNGAGRLGLHLAAYAHLSLHHEGLCARTAFSESPFDKRKIKALLHLPSLRNVILRISEVEKLRMTPSMTSTFTSSAPRDTSTPL